jgi:hypothetical protein
LHICPQFFRRLTKQIHRIVGVLSGHLAIMITRSRALIFRRRPSRAAI